MRRNKAIRLSEREYESLRDIKHDYFRTQDVPFGAVIRVLVNDYDDFHGFGDRYEDINEQ